MKIRWISSTDITAYRTHFWVYRPSDLANERLSEKFYTASIATPSNVRIDALFQYRGFTLAWVEDIGSDSGFLNYGRWTTPYRLTAVTLRVSWYLRRTINRLRGESPILKNLKIPERA